MTNWLRIGTGLLGLFALAGLAADVRADHCGGGCGATTYGTCAPAPQYATVTVCEMVPTQAQVQVTRYRWEQRQETFTVNKCELVPEQRQVSYTVMVPRYEQVNQPVTRSRMI